MLFVRLGIYEFSLFEGGRRNKVADRHSLLFGSFYDICCFFCGVIREDSFPHAGMETTARCALRFEHWKDVSKNHAKTWPEHGDRFDSPTNTHDCFRMMHPGGICLFPLATKTKSTEFSGPDSAGPSTSKTPGRTHIFALLL